MPRSSFFDLPDDPGDELLFLADLESENWARMLVYVQTLSFSSGETVVNEGADDRAVYVVQSGCLEAMVARGPNNERARVLIGPGSLFGEVAFFDGKPRSATITAVEDAELLRFTPEALAVMVDREPDVARAFLMDLGRLVAIRLRRAEQTIAGTDRRAN